jgi:hypothetical protein
LYWLVRITSFLLRELLDSKTSRAHSASRAWFNPGRANKQLADLGSDYIGVKKASTCNVNPPCPVYARWYVLTVRLASLQNNKRVC